MYIFMYLFIYLFIYVFIYLCIYLFIIHGYIYIYDGFSKVLFPISAKNRNSLRDAFSFTCKKSYTEDTSKMQ